MSSQLNTVFSSSSDSTYYYIGVFDKSGTFISSNYAFYDPYTVSTDEGSLKYYEDNYFVVILYDGLHYYLCNILYSNTSAINNLIIELFQDTTTNISTIINFSTLSLSATSGKDWSSYKAYLNKSSNNIDSYCTAITSSSCSAGNYIFGDMSNSQAGPTVNSFQTGHNICVSNTLFNNLNSLIGVTIPSSSSSAPKTTNSGYKFSYLSPTTTTTPSSSSSSSTWIWILIVIIVIIIIIILAVGGFFIYKKHSESKIETK